MSIFKIQKYGFTVICYLEGMYKTGKYAGNLNFETFNYQIPIVFAFSKMICTFA
jgi:hypothetical protein